MSQARFPCATLICISLTCTTYKVFTLGGTWTLNPQIRSLMRYPIAPQGMAHPDGVEPSTSRLTVERSNQTELWVNILGHSRIWTSDHPDCSRTLYPWAICRQMLKVYLTTYKNNAHCGIWTHAYRNTSGLKSDPLDQLGQVRLVPNARLELATSTL
jgi:hypothetical protein